MESPRAAFVYSNPERIYWGAGCVAEQLDKELDRLGTRRAFVVTTRSVAAHPELAPALQRQLGDRFVGCYAGITEHAPVHTVAEAVEVARRAEPDVLVSIGGGSPIDAAKAVAFSLATGLDVAAPDASRAARRLTVSRQDLLPHLAIPTTLSAAELGYGAGFTEAGTRVKSGLFARDLLPAAVFYDAELAAHTPLQLWLATGIRAVDHAVEGMLAPQRNPYSDALSLAALRHLKPGLLAVQADPESRDARTECQIGAWLSDSMPLPSGFGLSHMLGKQLGSRHGIPHGVTSCIILPHVMRYRATQAEAAPILARIAEALGVQIAGMATEQAAAAAADAVQDLVLRLDLPRHLAQYGVEDADLLEAVRPVAARDPYPEADLLSVLRAAR